MSIDKEIEKLKLEKEVLKLKLKLAEFEERHPTPKYVPYIPYIPYYEPIITAPILPKRPEIWCKSSSNSGAGS